MQTWSVLVLLCLFSIAFSANLNIIPQPQYLTTKPFSLTIEKKATIIVGEGCDKNIGEILGEDIKSLDLNVEEISSSFIEKVEKPIIFGIPSLDKNIASFVEKKGIDVPKLPREGYVLEVGENYVAVIGNDRDGVFWGMQTIRQMLRGGKGKIEIPGARIVDYPKLRWRGITDDVSRGPIPTLEYMKNIVRTLSAFKLNMYTPYIELHAFNFKSHPDMSAPGEGLSPEEMKELVAYGRKYHVEVFPSLQSFGHSDKLLRKPQYRHLAEIEESPWSLSPALEETYKLFNDLYNELAEIFPSPFFNINCDETYDLGQGKSKPIADEIGPANLYLRHITRLQEMLKKKGKRVMFWGDIALHYREMIPKLPPDIIVLNWDYGGAPSFEWRLQPFYEAGLEQFVCPGVSCWSRIFPDFENATVNINNFVRDGVKFKASGMLNTTWDDDGENLFGYNWYGIVFGAEAAWCGGNIDRGDFDKRFDNAFFGSTTRIVEAINLLSQTNLFMAPGMSPDAFFWEDPLQSLKRADTIEKAKEIKKRAERALAILQEDGGKVRKNKTAIPYLVFAGNRLLFLADKILGMAEVSSIYESVRENPQEGKEKLDKAKEILQGLIDRLYQLRENYKTLWLSENLPFFLNNNIDKYNRLIQYLESKRETILKAKEAISKGEPIPAL
ncbi:family 20 glycosylhydrolase [bacterium]|nr:family 20 glycosylhydrolase [bacterium]